jgi:8-oxo-dGTP pyrophosphatase MutT (NUDIX family)
MDRKSLVQFFKKYTTPFPEEQIFTEEFLSLLEHPDCFERTHLPGHITGSAWITDSQRQAVLLVHHGKLNRWMQPGGHADGDENVLRVALKEAEEETGLQNFRVAGTIPFDIDIHVIPARSDFPMHQHFDVRFLLEANRADHPRVSAESHDVKWIRLDELEQYTTARSVLRMKEKLLRTDQ